MAYAVGVGAIGLRAPIAPGRPSPNAFLDLHNKLLLFTYTSTAALLGVAATMDDSYVCLVPIPVVLLISLRVAYYRDATAKLAAYQIVFIEPLLEGIKWEGRNASQASAAQEEGQGASRLAGKLRYWDFPFICLVCFLVFLLKGGWNLPHRLLVLHGVVAAIAPEVLVSWSIHSIEPAKRRWADRWEAVKRAERADGGEDK